MIADIIEKKWSFPVFCGFLIILIIAKSALMGEFGVIGPDSDDAMRLAQIRDFLQNGQSWFDTDQYRMGLASGTDMHWTRLVDIPLIGLIAAMDLFLPYATAERIAISIWPPITSVFVLSGVFTGARFLKNRQAAWIATILAALFLLTHYRFSSGAIDHHNIQFGLICLAIGFALDPDFRARTFAICGISLGLSLVVGTDIYIFAGMICLFIALLWLTKGPVVKNAAIAFGVALSMTLVLSFLIVLPPSDYGQIYCDSLSWIVVAAGALGGLGLAGLAFKFSGLTPSARFISLSLLGLACLALLLSQAPQCLSNPLDVLPNDVKTLWLENIVEAQPLLAAADAHISAPLGLGVTITALILSVIKIKTGERAIQYSFLAFILCGGTLLSLYQMRFVGFGQFLSFMVLGIWVYDLAQKTNDKGERSIAYIGALALSIPMIWVLPGVMMDRATLNATDIETKVQTASNAELCYSDKVIAYFNTLPTGRILATDNGTPIILTETGHSALGGNYHRNAEGIQMSIRAYTVPPVDAMDYLKRGQIDYVHLCRTTQETIALKDFNPDGLAGALFEGQRPDYLEELKTLEDGAVSIYRFTSR